MGGHRQRARLILFAAAVIAPCVVLVAVGVRIGRDDREFRWARRAAARQQAVAQAQRALSAALDPILAGEIRDELAPGERYRHTETILVAWAEGDKLALPWEPEHDRVARASRDLLSRARFAAALHDCDQVKSRSGRNSLAGACYQRVLESTDHAGQAAYARWLWARDASESGRASEAARLYRDLLRSPPHTADENGVPLALLAAQALARDRARRAEVTSAVESIVAARPWLSPMSCYAASSIAETFSSDAGVEGRLATVQEVVKKVAVRVRVVEQAEGLQNNFASVRAQLSRRRPNAWAAFGEEPWLIGIAEPSASTSPVVVVRGQDLMGRLAIPGAVRLAGASDLEGDVLGDSFPGVKLVLSSVLFDEETEARRGFLRFALVLVVAATGFAAWLLWRDLRREVRLSELQTQFVASVSHELKTPLTAIRMFAETMQMGRCRDRETQEEYLGTIVSECERLSRLVDGVLLFSKGEQGKRAYRFKSLQAADAVHAAVRALEYPLAQHGFRLHMNVRDDAPLVLADRDALEQAVLNLISNAMKYSSESRDIELGLYSEDGDVVIRVSDHGIGIAPDEHSRIFEKFYRVPTGENQLIPGAGLGLALVAQIMKAHTGRVMVESAPGKGSTFLLRLPALNAPLVEETTHEHHSCD